MRCPKCGAFLDPGKDVCFMCGVNIKTYVPDSNSFASQNKDFGSGNQYANPTPNFTQNTDNTPSWQQNNKKTQDKDIFDIYGEHKTLIRIVLLIILIGIVIFAGVKYYQHKTKQKPLVPVVQDLYFEVDDNFDDISQGGREGLIYSLSGDKGNDCSISVFVDTNLSDNFVEDYFESAKVKLNPELDQEGKIIDEMKIYSPQENEITINGSKWYYLNIFYRKDLESDFNILKYKYMVAIKNGFSYTIILNNSSNNNTCNSGLDNFVKSLEFVEK